MKPAFPTLTFVVPVFNEAKRIGPLLNDLLQFQGRWTNDIQLVISDDGSTDDSISIIKAHPVSKALANNNNFQLVQSTINKGKGHAIQQGVRQAKFNFTVIIDADNSYSPLLILQWFKQLNNQFHTNTLYIADRTLKTSAYSGERQTRLRKILSALFQGYIRLITGLNFKDTQAGFKCIPTSIAKQLYLHLQCLGWMQDIEILFKAKLCRYPIHPMPVEWNQVLDSKLGEKKQRLFKELFILPFKINRFRKGQSDSGKQ